MKNDKNIKDINYKRKKAREKDGWTGTFSS